MEKLGNHCAIIDNLSNYGIIPTNEILNLYNYRKKYYTAEVYNIDFGNFTNEIDLLIEKYKPDIIIHMAGFPRQEFVKTNPKLASDVMIGGTIGLLEAAKKYNVKRFVYISSSMVYGNFINSVDENHPTNPTNLYGVLKLTGESLIKDYCRNTNIQYNIIRPSAVYGKRDIKNRVVNKFILAAINGTPLKVCGVNEKLDFTYVDDTVNGIVLATLNNEHFDKIYNITRAVSHTILDAAKIIVNIVGKGEIKIENKHTDYPSRSSLIINKATTELGYVPKTDIKEGFQKCYEWIKNTIY